MLNFTYQKHTPHCTVCVSLLYLLFCLMAWSGPQNQETRLPALTLRPNQAYPLAGLTLTNAVAGPPDVISMRNSTEGIELVAHNAGKGYLRGTPLGVENAQPIIMDIFVTPSHNNSTDNNGHSDQNGSAGISSRKTKRNQMQFPSNILSRDQYQQYLGTLTETSKTRQRPLSTMQKVGPGIKQSLVEQATTALRQAGMHEVHIQNAGHRYAIVGSVATPEEVMKALELCTNIIPNIENHLPIPIALEPTITIQVFLLELSKKAHEQLGIKWSQLAAPMANVNLGTAATMAATFSGTNWEVFLRQLSQRGLAKVLAEPILAVKKGSSAEMSAGGEFPIKLTEKFENRVSWKHYGLKLKIHIAGIAGKRIRTKISTESSQLESALSVGGIPAVRTNKLSTEIDALDQQTILLTGLFQSATSKDVEKVPLLGSIPIIGELFKSRSTREEESELLVALQPKLETFTTALPLKGFHLTDLDTDIHWND